MHSEPVFVRTLSQGAFFGEKALKGYVKPHNTNLFVGK